MAQSSRFWTTDDSSPDAPLAGYSADQFAAFIKKAFGDGVLHSIEDELAVSGTTSPVVVTAGACFGAGYFYESTANEDIPIDSPVIGDTGFRIVVRFTWATPEGRLYLNMSADGVASPPAAVRTEGTTWDITVVTGTITTAGAIALSTAEKDWAAYSSHVVTAMLNDGAVTEDKLGALAVTNAKIGLSAVTTSKLSVGAVSANEIAAGAVIEAKIETGAVTNTKIGDLAVTTSKLSVGAVSANEIAAGAVIEAKIGAGAVTAIKLEALAVEEAKINTSAVTNTKIGALAVDDAKIGDRVLKCPKRTGSHATEWDVAGTTGYTVTNVSMVAGMFTIEIPSQGEYTVTVNFPVTFSYAPLVFLQHNIDYQQDLTPALKAQDIRPYSFECYYRSTASAARTVTISYLAIGQL